MTDGTVIEGEVFDLGDVVRVRRSLGTMTVSKDRVLRIVAAPSLESQYEERSAALPKNDAPGRLSLAVWCRSRGLSAQARAECEKVIAVEPENETARKALGHERVNDRWMPFEDAQRARGRVVYQGEWMTPEERDVRIALDRRAEGRRAAEAGVRRLLRRAGTPDPQEREEIRRKLDAFAREERYGPALDALSDSEPDVRVLACEQLAAAGGEKAVVPLARRFVLDGTKPVRVAAGRALVEIDEPGTGEAFLTLFVNGNATAQRRAAEGLAAFPERRAVPALVAALEQALHEPPEISLTMAGPAVCAPGGPLVVSGGTVILPPLTPSGPAAPGTLPRPRVLAVPRVVTSLKQREDPAVEAAREAYKESVLDALRACSGEDFGERVEPWKAWWVRQAAETNR